MSEYVDPIIALVIEKLNSEGPAQLQGRYYHGDVLLVPKQELPIVSVAKDNTVIRAASNLEDEHYMPLVINILLDYTADLDQSSDLVAGVTRLYEMCEARNGDYTLKADSLAYILRKYQQLDNNVWIDIGPNEELNIDYGLGINRRGPGIFSVEAVIHTAVKIHTGRAT